jgi:hypothetical protein
VQSTAELTDDTPLEFLVLLDHELRASARFNLNRKIASTLTAQSRDGQVVVTLGADLPVDKVRVFGPDGEIAEGDIVVKQQTSAA